MHFLPPRTHSSITWKHCIVIPSTITASKSSVCPSSNNYIITLVNQHYALKSPGNLQFNLKHWALVFLTTHLWALQLSSTINWLSINSKGFSDYDFAEENRTSCSNLGLLGLKISFFLVTEENNNLHFIYSFQKYSTQFTTTSANHPIVKIRL